MDEAVAAVPRCCAEAKALKSIRRRIAGGGVDAGTMSRISRRIHLIEQALTAPIAESDVLSPTSAASAKLSPAWTASMIEELDCMERFGVWKLVPPPPGANIIDCKWVFRTKFDKRGLPSRLKSRLTAKGFTQRKGVDYLETWAPTCRHRSFRMMLAEASTIPAERLVTSAWDTTAAFLHAKMDHVAYMRQPPGFEDPAHPDDVCLLYKSIYGLKSSSRLFYLMLRDRLVGPEINARQSETDNCVFVIRGPGDQFMKLALWVDDIAVVSNSRELYDSVFAELIKHFAFRAEPLEHFLGFVIDRRADGSFTLSQWPYVKELTHYQRRNHQKRRVPATSFASP